MRYKLREESSPQKSFQNERVKAFDDILKGLEQVRTKAQKAKQDTINYYKLSPESYSVVYSTDIIKDYLKDIETLLQP